MLAMIQTESGHFHGVSYESADRVEALRECGQMAARMEISWLDAAYLSKIIRQQGTEEWEAVRNEATTLKSSSGVNRLVLE